MATRVQIAFDLSATAGVNFFTLDDTDKGVLDNTAYLLGGDVFKIIEPENGNLS